MVLVYRNRSESVLNRTVGLCSAFSGPKRLFPGEGRAQILPPAPLDPGLRRGTEPCQSIQMSAGLSDAEAPKLKSAADSLLAL